MARWYIIHAYSGFENKVRDAIMADATRLGLDALVESVEVPTETVTEVRRGKKVQSEKKFFPGYVLAKLSMNDDVYHLVKNTPKVTGFLGSIGQAAGDQRSRSRTHPQHPRRSSRRAQDKDQGRLRDRRFGEGARRPVRELQRHCRGARFRPQRASRCRFRSSAAPRRSNWSSSKSSGASEAKPNVRTKLAELILSETVDRPDGSCIRRTRPTTWLCRGGSHNNKNAQKYPTTRPRVRQPGRATESAFSGNASHYCAARGAGNTGDHPNSLYHRRTARLPAPAHRA